MGSRSSSPSSGVRDHPETHSNQRNKALGLHTETSNNNSASQKKGSYFSFLVDRNRKDHAGRRYSNALPPPGGVKKVMGGGGGKKKKKGVSYKKVHVSPKKGASLKNSSQSKSEPSLRISDWEGVGYTSPYEINNDNGTIRDSNTTSTPPHVARNSNGNSGGNSPNRSPANSQRVRLLQVGRLSPVDPKTNRPKIPVLKKSKTTSILSDSHEYTGYKEGGTRSLNMELHYAACTRAGNDVKAARKANQDTFFMEDCLGGNPHMHLFGVFDGHGVNGHICSHFIRDSILKAIGSNNKSLLGGGDPTRLLEKACINAQKNLSENPHINSKFSGCTGTILTIDTKNQKMYTCNVGDSRIILGKGKQRSAEVVELTTDHSPDVSSERTRIEKAGGRVADFSGVARVCLKSENIPGLAMSRSFGDELAKSIGVSCQPDSTSRALTPEDRFVVVGSDGIFDFLSHISISSTVSECLHRGTNPQDVASRLVCEAVKRWKRGKNNYVDDVTVIVVYLNAHPGKGKIKV
ncbi:hypothetical protein TrLO_g15446 [Triparma laevis f. longispina]|uniref:PPM-type phosphatase domain-containing protein n=1 Tax=Triparma laevis f. longispina TaxID=1714387 RepID=A0A9W7F5Q3_9STRA|nr:hypothetical protein TrLO_g15446 [Triparma laevis f. longispina]